MIYIQAQSDGKQQQTFDNNGHFHSSIAITLFYNCTAQNWHFLLHLLAYLYIAIENPHSFSLSLSEPRLLSDKQSAAHGMRAFVFNTSVPVFRVILGE